MANYLDLNSNLNTFSNYYSNEKNSHSIPQDFNDNQTKYLLDEKILPKHIETLKTLIIDRLFPGFIFNESKINKMVSETSDVDALYHYGRSFFEQGEFKKAFEKFGIAAIKGDLNALSHLAICYETGTGTEKKVSLAMKLYEIAANKGDQDAMFNLGLCYEKGANYEKAKHWYIQASSQRKALYNLAHFYFHGKGVLVDKKEGMKFLIKSAVAGSKRAHRELDKIREVYSSDEENYSPPKKIAKI